MERIFGRVFFAVFFGRHPDGKLGRAGKAAPVWNVKPVLCRPVSICGIRLRRLFSVFMQEENESFWHDGFVCVHKVWSDCAARRDWMVCIFAWLSVCQRACLHEVSGNAAGTAVCFSADPFLYGGIFWDRQDFIRNKDRSKDADGISKIMAQSEPVFAAVVVSLYCRRCLDGSLCESAVANELYTQDVRKFVWK